MAITSADLPSVFCSDSSSGSSDSPEYTLILTLRYSITTMTSTSTYAGVVREDHDTVFIHNSPDIEDEYLHTATITLKSPAPARVAALRAVNPEKTLIAVVVANDGGMDFPEELGVDIPVNNWDVHLDMAIIRTEKILEELEAGEITAEDDFEIEKGDENHFGDYDDHQEMITGEPSDKKEYEII